MKMEKKSGPSAHPWGTPIDLGKRLILCYWFLLVDICVGKEGFKNEGGELWYHKEKVNLKAFDVQWNQMLLKTLGV